MSGADVETRSALEFHDAVKRNDTSKVENLLSLGVDVDIRDKAQQTPLHTAAVCNVGNSYFKLTEILLKNGANPNARCNASLSPLYWFVSNGNV